MSRSIFVLGSLSPVTALSPPPVTQPADHDPGLPLGTLGGTHLCLLVEDPLLRNRAGAHLGWGGGCGTGSRLAQLCRSVTPFCLSLILATAPGTGEFQMVNFLRDLG